jgi:hypothetical protein
MSLKIYIIKNSEYLYLKNDFQKNINKYRKFL